jgi:hypothetical protein
MSNLSGVPEWMADCRQCQELLSQLFQPGLPPLAEFEQMRAHLVEAHLVQVPGYADDCANCQEWKALSTSSMDGIAGRMVPVLGREELLHRAGHLLYEIKVAPE